MRILYNYFKDIDSLDFICGGHENAREAEMQDLGLVICLASMSYDQSSNFYSLDVETKTILDSFIHIQNQLLKANILLGCGAKVCEDQSRKEQDRRQ